MAAIYKTPGVYVDEIVKFPPSVAPVETAIPAFIGYTEKANHQANDQIKPKKISSMVEYEAYFGKADKEKNIKVTIENDNEQAVAAIGNRSPYIMYYALQLFFANGGGPCYIVSVGTYDDPATIPSIEKLKNGLKTLEKEDEPTLIIFPEAQQIKISDFHDLYEKALKQCYELKDRFVIIDMPEIATDIASYTGKTDKDTKEMTAYLSDFKNIINCFRGTKYNGSDISGSGTENLQYGAAYFPNIETTLDFNYDEGDTEIDVKDEDLRKKILALAGKKEGDSDAGTIDASKKIYLNDLKNQHNKLYEMSRKAIKDIPCTMPPAAAIAGVYAAVDNSRGVWKAPANVNLNAVIRPVIQISNEEQDWMNVDANSGKSINALRSFTGRGTLVWGARTLAGNDNEWRYINVRRFFNFAEESIKKATEPFVFEPNDANTWVRVQAMIENFLTTLWRQGALQGVKPEHAFYVAIGLGKTMTALDILEGRMIIEIGMAVVRPAEFIILNFSHKMAES